MASQIMEAAVPSFLSNLWNWDVRACKREWAYLPPPKKSKSKRVPHSVPSPSWNPGRPVTASDCGATRRQVTLNNSWSDANSRWLTAVLPLNPQSFCGNKTKTRLIPQGQPQGTGGARVSGRRHKKPKECPESPQTLADWVLCRCIPMASSGRRHPLAAAHRLNMARSDPILRHVCCCSSCLADAVSGGVLEGYRLRGQSSGGSCATGSWTGQDGRAADCTVSDTHICTSCDCHAKALGRWRGGYSMKQRRERRSQGNRSRRRNIAA
jgi:hypothetical protein